MHIKKLLVVLLFMTINSFAQITLKQHHFVSIGDTIVEYYKTRPQNPIHVGKPGENKIWDFSNLNAVATKRDTLRFLNPKDTPFSTDYPNSNIALYSNNGYEAWIFMKSSKKELAHLGYGVFINNEKRTDNYGGITMNFPLKYLDEFSNETVNERILLKTKDGIAFNTLPPSKTEVL